LVARVKELQADRESAPTTPSRTIELILIGLAGLFALGAAL
jgi:hypothetical protein